MYLYDYNHCRGTDLKLKDNIKGIITLNVFNDITDTSQAIYRLRKIELNQTIILINREYDNKEALYTKLYNNLDKYKQSQKYNYLCQTILASDKFKTGMYESYVEKYSIIPDMTHITYNDLYNDIEKYRIDNLEIRSSIKGDAITSINNGDDNVCDTEQGLAAKLNKTTFNYDKQSKF